jgi:hypothetical protein
MRKKNVYNVTNLNSVLRHARALICLRVRFRVADVRTTCLKGIRDLSICNVSSSDDVQKLMHCNFVNLRAYLLWWFFLPI